MAVNDSDTTVSDLQTTIKDFCNERGWEQFHNSKDWSVSASNPTSRSWR